MNNEEQLSIILDGKGNTKEVALANAISGLQKQINNKMKGTIIRIEPLEIKFLEGTEQRYTEKFLFLFMKREISTFYLKIEVLVRVFSVDYESFEFKLVESKRKFYK